MGGVVGSGEKCDIVYTHVNRLYINPFLNA